jgi:ferrous iron transport protein A
VKHATPAVSPSLAAAQVGCETRVRHVDADPEAVRWLEAVGIAQGESLVVLRRASFGGPIHVRTGAGGEFALCLALARTIAVLPDGCAAEPKALMNPGETREIDGGEVEAREVAAE